MVIGSAVTVSICEFAVGFGWFLQKKLVHGSVSVFTVPDFNHWLRKTSVSVLHGSVLHGSDKNAVFGFGSVTVTALVICIYLL